jgi:hypothetical protein
MSRRCRCHSRCHHLVPDPEILLTPERLERLAAALGILVDAAHAFDGESFTFDPACGIHGERDVSNAECICLGQRWSAAEFVKSLEYELRAHRSRDMIRSMQHEHQRDAYRLRAAAG